MWWKKALAVVVGALSALAGVASHGMMTEPRARNVVHNSNYCPHCLAAGGPGVTFAGGRVWPNSLHGACGDPHTGPLDHEAGGKFATKVITGTYVRGQRVTLRIKITAPHGGRFLFGVCPVPDGASDADERRAVTQACFDANPLTNAEDGTRFWWFGKKAVGEYTMDFTLPPNVSCKRCVLQWHYESGNSCTIPGTPAQHVMSPNMVPCDATSVMEEFWNCADVEIKGDGKAQPPPPVRRKFPPPKKGREGFAVPAPNGAGLRDTHDLRDLAFAALVVVVAVLALPPALAVSVAAGAGAWYVVWTLRARGPENRPVALAPRPRFITEAPLRDRREALSRVCRFAPARAPKAWDGGGQ
jgi:hypothetical protein